MGNRSSKGRKDCDGYQEQENKKQSKQEETEQKKKKLVKDQQCAAAPDEEDRDAQKLASPAADRQSGRGDGTAEREGAEGGG